MYLQDGTRDHFMRWLHEHHPGLVDGYTRLYAKSTRPADYRNEVKRVVTAAKTRHGLGSGR